MSTPRRGRRNVSESVRNLHNTLTRILSDGDRAFFIQTLNQYQRDRDVQELVVSLKSVLDSPKKREVYPILREIIPTRDRNYFDRYWQGNRAQVRPVGISSTRSRSRSPARSPPRNLRRSHTSASLPENLNKYDSGIDLQSYRNNTTPRSHKYPIRKLQIKRPTGSGFGFCMRGGSEHGVGLYVSSVDRNSISEVEGLLPGDHILTVNDVKFDGLSHDQAVKIIRSSKKLSVVVRSVGRIPNTFVAEAAYKWIDPYGKQIEPPSTVDSRGRALSMEGIHKSDLRLLGDDDERKVNVFVEDSGKLGLKIRGGSEYGLGIYIADVDVYSAADRAGLKCGDQIMDVNGTSFLDISHNNAIKILKANRNMMITIKDVGRLPFAKTMKDKTRWSKGQMPNNSPPNDAVVLRTTTADIHAPPPASNTSSNRRKTHEVGHWGMHNVERPEQSKFQHGIAGTQLIYNGTGPSTRHLTAEQARQVLNENELGTMTYYMEEYTRGYISVSAFVLALFDLFNTPAKVSLLSEIRGAILPKDIDRFDDLVLKREVEAMKARRTLFTHDDTHSNHSYNSSLSSYSGRGSISSRSSAKESYDDADSRPITPPRVPDILPHNIKINDDLPYPPVPWAIQTSLPPPPPPLDNDVIGPLSTSSHKSRDVNDNHMTNGEVTSNNSIGDNSRRGTFLKNNSAESGLEMVAPRKSKTHGRQRYSTPKHDSRSSKHDYALVNGDMSSSHAQKGKTAAMNINEDLDRTLRADESHLHNRTLVYSPDRHERRESSERNGLQNSSSPTKVKTKVKEHAREENRKINYSNSNVLQSSPRNGEVSGMMLAMDINAADRSGLERSTGWGEEVAPSMSNPMYELCNPSVTQITQSGVTNGTIDRPSAVVSTRLLVSRTGDRLTSRRGSGANRKSWDGVRTPEEEEANVKISTLEQKKALKSSSDSNLMNLPKNEQKNIQVKLKASQELFDLHQHSKNKPQDIVNNSNSHILSPPTSHNASAYEVEMEKSGVGLGLTIDGGCDTQSPVKIKQVKNGDYAAIKCERLKAGQTILQINGQSLEGMTNGIATLQLRLAYADPDMDTVRLLVSDTV